MHPVPPGCAPRVCPVSLGCSLGMCPVPPPCAPGCTLGCAQCLWDEPYVPNPHPRICPGMHPAPCCALWGALCASLCPHNVLCAHAVCPRMCLACTVHPWMCPRMCRMPQDARWDAPQDVSCPPVCAPGCARGCAVTPRIHPGCAVCPEMCPKCCAPLAAPLCPPSWCHWVFSHWRGVHGVLHHWGGGLRAPGPPLSAPGLAGAAGREGTVPTAPLQKGKRLILLPGHAGVSASTWGKARALPGPRVLLPEERGQPQSLP